MSWTLREFPLVEAFIWRSLHSGFHPVFFSLLTIGCGAFPPDCFCLFPLVFCVAENFPLGVPFFPVFCDGPENFGDSAFSPAFFNFPSLCVFSIYLRTNFLSVSGFCFLAGAFVLSTLFLRFWFVFLFFVFPRNCFRPFQVSTVCAHTFLPSLPTSRFVLFP